MITAIRVRDVVRGDVYEFGAEEPVLRPGDDLLRPVGPVELRDNVVEWFEGEALRTSRVAPALLGDAEIGERVLIRDSSDEQWWLCDVEAIDGAARGPMGSAGRPT
jgi:hypothetical protein